MLTSMRCARRWSVSIRGDMVNPDYILMRKNADIAICWAKGDTGVASLAIYTMETPPHLVISDSMPHEEADKFLDKLINEEGWRVDDSSGRYAGRIVVPQLTL